MELSLSEKQSFVDRAFGNSVEKKIIFQKFRFEKIDCVKSDFLGKFTFQK